MLVAKNIFNSDMGKILDNRKNSEETQFFVGFFLLLFFN